MAAIDSGALLKVNGKFINKNGKLFTSISDLGFDLKKVQGELSNRIGDSFNVCAGDEKLLLAFKTRKEICKRKMRPEYNLGGLSGLTNRIAIL